MKRKKVKNTNEDSLKNIESNINSTIDNNINSSLGKYSYLKIDPSINFKKITLDEIKAINDKLEKNNKDQLIPKKEFINEIIKIFLEKYYPKYEGNTSKINSIISSQIKSRQKLNKEKMEVYINYFYNAKENFKTSKILVLNKRIFRNIGIMLCYIYHKLKDYKIDTNGIKDYINTIISKKINILSDYFLYCNNCGTDPMLLKKSYEWKKLIKIYNYQVPPELIFLVNIFQNILKLEIDIEFGQDNLTQEDFQLYTMTLLNIEYVFPNLENISLNLVHKNLQEFINKQSIHKMTKLLLNTEYTKKNYIKDNISKYSIKWDFEAEFDLAYYNNIKTNSKKNRKHFPNEKYSNIIYFDEKEIHTTIKSITTFQKNRKIIPPKNIADKNKKINDTDFVDLEYDEFDNDASTSTTNSSTDIYRVKAKQNINETKEEKNKQFFALVDKNKMIYDFILITFCCVSWNQIIRKLNIISNTFYTKGLIDNMRHFYDLDNQKKFHIFDILYNKQHGLNSLNIEFNSLDIFTFNKLLEIIYMNMTWSSINISFFSSDVSYLFSPLFQIYTEQLKSTKEIDEFIIKKGKNFTIEELEKKIINDISGYFLDNLANLFEIIRNKKEIKELGFNFDIPSNIITNNNYKISIFKFLLNILMLVDNKESEHKTNIKKLTLLAPKIVFDARKENSIDNFFENISLYKTSKTLMNLNIQFQFYRISNLKNLISRNLITLSLGDLDLYTFDNLLQYLTSYDFSINTNLSHLNIKLLRMITNFNIQMKLMLQRLFSINLKNLLELKLCTNLIIDKKANYLFFLKLLHNNWIHSYVITLNKKSRLTVGFFNLFKNNKIFFLVSETIQNIVFQDTFSLMRKHNFFSTEIFWILKRYLFKKQKEDDINVGKFGMQCIIFNILKYLFLTSNVKLEHQYYN